MKRRTFNKRKYFDSVMVFVVALVVLINLILGPSLINYFSGGTIVNSSYESKKYNIKTLDAKNEMSGSFILGTGTIDNSTYYYSLVDRNDGGYTFEKFEIPLKYNKKPSNNSGVLFGLSNDTKKPDNKEYTVLIDPTLNEDEQPYLEEVYVINDWKVEKGFLRKERTGKQTIHLKTIFHLPTNYIKQDFVN